jgi:2-polyprenyl-6-hydroxyphenyl methylase/3-demethylubiquinone-9 3-methyltransferase
MPVDNQLYDRLAGSWWEESGLLHVLAALTPPRFGAMRRALDGLEVDPRGRRVLDVGCGGGLLAEEFAGLGCEVSGVDPSRESIAAARVHAEAAGLRIDYREGTGESLPFPDAAFDIAYCCDVLEHVADLPRVIAETARVLRPGGVFLYDTLNRTPQSWLVIIKVLQEWSWTSFLPPGLHDWNLFIKPAELLALLARNGLQNRGLTGLKPAAGPLRALRILRALKRREITYAEAARRLDLRESRDTSMLYLGHAVKHPPGRDNLGPVG